MEFKPELKKILTDDEENIKETEKNQVNGCSLCDAGYIDGKLCECLKLTIMKRKYNNCNIDYDFASIPIIEDDVIAYLKDDSIPEGKFEINLNAFLEDYALHSKENISIGKGIIFAGPVGRGKSLSAMKILMYLVDKGYTGYFTTIKNFFDIIKKSWSDDEYVKIKEHIYKCDFLVIDDLGTEYAKQDSDWSLTEIDGLMRHRYFKKLPVIITTNSPLDKLTAKYAQRIVSLFHERSMIVPIISKEDYREKLSNVPKYMDKDKFKK